MFCIYCGKETVDGARFCQYCGKPIATPGGNNQPVQALDDYRDRFIEALATTIKRCINGEFEYVSIHPLIQFRVICDNLCYEISSDKSGMSQYEEVFAQYGFEYDEDIDEMSRYADLSSLNPRIEATIITDVLTEVECMNLHQINIVGCDARSGREMTIHI